MAKTTAGKRTFDKITQNTITDPQDITDHINNLNLTENNDHQTNQPRKIYKALRPKLS